MNRFSVLSLGVLLALGPASGSAYFLFLDAASGDQVHPDKPLAAGHQHRGALLRQIGAPPLSKQKKRFVALSETTVKEALSALVPPGWSLVADSHLPDTKAVPVRGRMTFTEAYEQLARGNRLAIEIDWPAKQIRAWPAVSGGAVASGSAGSATGSGAAVQAAGSGSQAGSASTPVMDEEAFQAFWGQNVAVQYRGETLLNIMQGLVPQGWKVDMRFTDDRRFDLTAQAPRWKVMNDIAARAGVRAYPYRELGVLVVVRGAAGPLENR